MKRTLRLLLFGAFLALAVTIVPMGLSDDAPDTAEATATGDLDEQQLLARLRPAQAETPVAPAAPVAEPVTRSSTKPTQGTTITRKSGETESEREARVRADALSSHPRPPMEPVIAPGIQSSLNNQPTTKITPTS